MTEIDNLKKELAAVTKERDALKMAVTWMLQDIEEAKRNGTLHIDQGRLNNARSLLTANRKGTADE